MGCVPPRDVTHLNFRHAEVEAGRDAVGAEGVVGGVVDLGLLKAGLCRRRAHDLADRVVAPGAARVEDGGDAGGRVEVVREDAALLIREGVQEDAAVCGEVERGRGEEENEWSRAERLRRGCYNLENVLLNSELNKFCADERTVTFWEQAEEERTDGEVVVRVALVELDDARVLAGPRLRAVDVVLVVLGRLDV